MIIWRAAYDDHPARVLARRSYELVDGKDKDAWLDLFAVDAVVEDPVGPSLFDPAGQGHRGREAIGEFWDAAIAPVVGFRFEVHDSFAGGDSCANRATFTTELADGTVATTELITVHRVDADGRLVSMRAHWEVEQTMASLRHKDDPPPS